MSRFKGRKFKTSISREVGVEEEMEGEAGGEVACHVTFISAKCQSMWDLNSHVGVPLKIGVYFITMLTVGVNLNRKYNGVNLYNFQ